jgi:hypothetical protein
LLPPSPLRLLPAGTTVAGRDSHPLKMHDFSRRTRMAGMLIRLSIGVLLAVVLELLNGVFTFLLPPFIIITPICLVIALIWAANSVRKWK